MSEELLGDVDVILDGTDNFETRYLINDYRRQRGVAVDLCRRRRQLRRDHERPAGRNRLPGLHLPGFAARHGRNLRHLRDSEFRGELRGVRRCHRGDEAGHRRPRQAAPHAAVVRRVDERARRDQHCQAARRAAAPASSATSFIWRAKARPHITLCGRNSVQIHERQRPMDFAEITRRLDPHGTVRHNEFVLKFWREPYELTLFPDGRAIIKGTTDTAIARSLYARYMGS